MIIADRPPDFWADWCRGAGIPEDRIDDASIMLFFRRAWPAKAVLSELCRAIMNPDEKCRLAS